MVSTAATWNTSQQVTIRTRQGLADMFTMVSALILLLTAVNLWLFDESMTININAVVTGVAGFILGAIGFLRPRWSRWTAWGAALLGLNGILYYLSVYAEACAFDGLMTTAFWISALATSALFGQVVVPRGRVQRPETDEEAEARKAAEALTGGRSRRIRRRVATGSIVLYVVLTLFAFVAMLPFLWMISTSFMTLGETINRTWVPTDLQVCNYYEAWETAQFSIYFTNSVIIAFTTIVGLLIVTILSAYAFARIKFYGRGLIFTMLLATLMVPEIVVMIPNFLTVSGQVFPIPVGREVFPFIEFGTGDQFTWIDTLPALSVPFMGSAFAIFLLRQFFVQIPWELWEAARIDGAGHLRFLIQIVVPMSRPAILTVTLLTFIGSWNSLLWPLLVTFDPVKWRPISYGLQAFSDDFGTQIHLLMAGAFITILPMLVLYFLTQKTFTEGIATTGLKG